MIARRDVLKAALAALLLGSGFYLIGEDLCLQIKARLADRFIARSLAAHLVDGREHIPWAWADTHPLALLRVDRLKVQRHVLSSASTESMAFGIGHVDGSAPVNGHGNCVLAGHRDSWCRFMKDLRVGDTLTLQSYGSLCRYTVADAAVVDHRDRTVTAPTAGPQLTLVTCYPFFGLLNSPWRYAVTCRRLASEPSRSVALAR